MSQEDLQRYLPQQDVLNLLSDIDDYFSARDGYAGTQTQERVELKREEFKDRAKIVTMETVIFLKDLLDATDSIADRYRSKNLQLRAPWPNIHNAMHNLRAIVWLHTMWAQFHVYGITSFMDTRRGIERDMRITPFQYEKYVMRTSTDLLTSSFSSSDGTPVPTHAAYVLDRDIKTMLSELQAGNGR